MANGQQAKVTLTAQLASDYVQSFDKAIARAKELQKTIGKLTAAQKAMSRAADRVEKEVKEQGRATEKTAIQTTKYAQSTKVAQMNTAGLVSKVAGLAAAYLSVQAAIGFVSNSLQLAGEFSTQIATAGAVSNSTAAELENLTDIAREMGASTEFTATQAAEALTFLGRAGVEAAEQVAVLPKVLDLATASGMDLAGSTDILLSTMAQFKKPLTEATAVMDVMVKTVNTSKNDMTQFAEAMKFMGPTAKALGISLEEASAIIGILGNNGLNGSIATRALGTSLTRILKPTKAMREEMAKYNLEFTKDGEIKNFAGIIDELSKKLANATSVQKQAALATIFGGEAIQELNILMSAGAGTIVNYTEALENSSGAAQRTADRIRSSLGNQMKELTSATEEVKLAFIDALGDTMPALIDTATEAMRVFANTLKDPEVQMALQNMVSLLSSVVRIGAQLTNLGIQVGGAMFGQNTLAGMGGRMSEAVTSTVLPQTPSSGNVVNITSPVTVNIPDSVGGGMGASASSIASAVKFAMNDRNDELVSQVKRSTQL
ncbi:phage tail tape measure protein [Prochlorococcus sp. ALOHA_ZT_50]|jgi:TP901 family phage tail tape measure protein|uniref:phage tail tape measure protein n=1 Tax=Prochlorococcus sp. ALOHA_ZT_50 TaxID=2919303 RepID=UPI00257ECE34|nr:phage tail tape measure protein [Prochlorococcus sp. ALOHA_ZT_50]MCH2079070.1 phage tail tape measure protein [Prochlorococcus sp. ALOHA_ZT_50]MCH2079649.1 phage tail tape measure protein [Prochlorococcus sp. ALOHA_ZT_50]